MTFYAVYNNFPGSVSVSIVIKISSARNLFEILTLIFLTTQLLGARSGAVGRGTVLQAGRSGVRFLPIALWPWGWLSL